MSLLGGAKQKSSELSQPLLGKQGPFLFSEGTAEMELAVCCPSRSPLPVGSGKQLAIEALSLGQSPAGLCSVPAGRMGGPGQGSEGFHPPRKKTHNPFSFKSKFVSRQKRLLQVIYSPDTSCIRRGDFTEELYPLLEDLACGS